MSAGLLLSVVGATMANAAMVIIAPHLPARYAVRLAVALAFASLPMALVGRWLA